MKLDTILAIVKTMTNIESVDAIFMSGNSFYAAVPEHTDEITGKIVDAEDWLAGQGISANLHSWAHQGRDVSRSKPNGAKLIWVRQDDG